MSLLSPLTGFNELMPGPLLNLESGGSLIGYRYEARLAVEILFGVTVCVLGVGWL